MNDIYDKKCKKSVLARISSGSSFTNEISVEYWELLPRKMFIDFLYIW